VPAVGIYSERTVVHAKAAIAARELAETLGDIDVVFAGPILGAQNGVCAFVTIGEQRSTAQEEQSGYDQAIAYLRHKNLLLGMTLGSQKATEPCPDTAFDRANIPDTHILLRYDAAEVIT
jgi:hypothetical protein